MLLGALAAFIAGNTVSAVADQYAVLLGGRLLAAAGAASFAPPTSAAAFTQVPEQRRARALAVIVTSFTVATALGIPISTFVGAAFGWRAAFAGTAAMATVVLLGTMTWLPCLGAAGARPPGGTAALRTQAIAITLAVSLLTVTAEQVV